MKSTRSYLKMVFTVTILSMLWSCSPSVYSAGARFTDDLYATHDKQAIAKQVAVEREQARRAAEAAAQAEREYAEQQSSGNPYQEILADDYESAYARRLRGFESPSYKMPSSYYNFRYGNDAQYASAYDPSFYNVMVMGDEVWVEPKYITSMFGTWGRPVNVNLNFGFGGWGGGPYWGSSWGNPYWGWNSPYYGWNNPYWNYPYYGWGGGHYPGWGYPHWGGHYPSWGNGHGHGYYDKHTTYRPSYSKYSGSGSGSSSGYRSPSKYSSGSSSGTTNRGQSTTPSYRNRNDKSNSGSNNRYEPSQPASRPSYSPPSSNYPSGGSTPSSGSSGGGSYGGSSGRTNGSRGGR